MLGRLFAYLRALDWGIIVAVLFLFLFGISAIYSVELSYETGNFGAVQKQVIVFFMGVVLAGALARWNYLQLRNYARALYLGSVGLLVLVLMMGTVLNSSRSWFILGSFSFQPVEFMKVALVVVLARYFGEHARRRFGWREIMVSGLLTAIPVGLVMMQPDLGSASILIGIWGFMLLMAGLRPMHAFAVAVVAVPVAVIYRFFFMSEYQLDRIRVFLNPELDPLVTGYNITQAKIAIGSGQLFGRGLGFGSQSQLKFLPESQTDFIFAVIAEELGFIGVCVVLLAIGLLAWRMMKLARSARDSFTSFLLLGIFASLFIQMTVNIGVNLALLPATGVTLPFVSAGGSSLLISFIFIGIAQSIAVRTRPADTLENPWYAIDNNQKIV